jgi:probable rRNA maturation factor
MERSAARIPWKAGTGSLKKFVICRSVRSLYGEAVTTQVLRKAPRSPELSSRTVRALADAMLASLGLEDAELSVLLTDDRRIQELNREHRGKDKPTDVLSFPLDEDEVDTGSPRLLGDVVISLDTAERQARGRGRSLVEEVRFLLAHGILHLIGHDHAEPEEKRIMVAATRRLVRAAPIPEAVPSPRRRAPVRRASKTRSSSRKR